MEGLELGENYGHRSLHAGPSQSRTPNKGRSDEENTVDPRLTAEETAEEAKKRLKAEKKKRKLERAQKRALREAREARTALVDHEEPSGAVEDAPAEASTTKGKRKKRESLPADGQENDGRTKKRKSGTTKTRPSAPRQPSSDPENDPFTSSPIKLPPSSPPTFDDPNLDQEPESPVLLMKNRSKRTRKVEHQDDEETPARLLFPADHPALANGTSSSPEAAPSTAKEHPLATTSKQRTKATKPKPSANPTKSKPKSTAFQHSTPAGSTSQARRKPGRKPTKQTDEDLRKAFAKPSAMHEWLASKWVNLAELKRLEESGVLTYRKGKFSDKEKFAIRQHLATFKHMNRLDDQELLEVIHAKGRLSERKEFPKFWPECAAVVPGRPVKYVKDHVKREYDPLARKGPWKPEEDEALRRAQQTHPNQWAKISQIVERPELDCRCRWRDELQHQDTKVEGHWSSEEKAKLVKIVVTFNTALGQEPYGSEAPWDLVVEKMGGSRTRTQCRKQWQDKLRYTATKQPPPYTQKSKDSIPKPKGSNVNPAQPFTAKPKSKANAKAIPASPAKPLSSRIKSKEMIESEDEA